MRAEVVPWWRQAQADLATARVTALAGRHYATSWFAQQAVEKGLKAIFIEQRANYRAGRTISIIWREKCMLLPPSPRMLPC